MKALLQRYAVDADPLRTERRVEAALLGCAALLALVAAYLLLRIATATGVDPIAPAPDSVRVANLPGPGALAAEAREELLLRPLFWAERVPVDVLAQERALARAEEKSKKKQDKAAPRMKDVTVRGVYGSGDRGGVILSAKGEELRVAIGEEVEGWKLQRVTGDSATFVSGGASDVRELVPQVIEAPDAPAAQAEIERGSPPAAQGEPVEERLTLGGA